MFLKTMYPFYLFIFKALYLKHIISKESKL